MLNLSHIKKIKKIKKIALENLKIFKKAGDVRVTRFVL